MPTDGFINAEVKVRFAPSPTGYLHIGGARTALFNYLYARKFNGTFLLRIEDTDIKREKEDSIVRILEDMKWLGLSWDEGPVRQTQRLDIYKKFAEEMLEKGLAFKCYCTPEELETKRQKMKDEKLNPRYDGTCRHLTPEQTAQFEAEGRKPAIRFRVPDRKVTVNDLVRGEVIYDEDFAGDFVILKSDGTPSYNFAVVIDDYQMGVTIVMRGEEHLVNTPRQVLLYEAMGFQVPQFAHISMILSPSREKLSKRHGTVAVDLFKQEGYLPEAMVNYIALLGWSPPEGKELFSLDELIEAFSLDRVAKNPAVYDVEKLKWINSQHIQKMDNEKLLELLIPYLKSAGFVNDETVVSKRETLLKITEALKPRLVLLSDVAREAAIFFDDELHFDEQGKEALGWEATPAVFDAFLEVLDEYESLTADNFMEAIKKIQKKSGAKGKNLYVPLRAGITGQGHGIDMSWIMTILTPEQMKNRLKSAKQMVLA
ncbi:MAG: glutamate--tRNA ligase [Firmicutes bacterium]|nr:glutamate--tRNA ligase [Bacillota bacterium]